MWWWGYDHDHAFQWEGDGETYHPSHARRGVPGRHIQDGTDGGGGGPRGFHHHENGPPNHPRHEQTQHHPKKTCRRAGGTGKHQGTPLVPGDARADRASRSASSGLLPAVITLSCGIELDTAGDGCTGVASLTADLDSTRYHGPCRILVVLTRVPTRSSRLLVLRFARCFVVLVVGEDKNHRLEKPIHVGGVETILDGGLWDVLRAFDFIQ